MIRQQNFNGGKAVTFTQFKKAITQIDKIMNRLEKCMDERFAILNGKFSAMVGINTMNIDRAVNGLEDRLDKKLQRIFDVLDGVVNGIDKSDREIVLLGKQHDDLAKYCTGKIAYPTYGRNF